MATLTILFAAAGHAGGQNCHYHWSGIGSPVGIGLESGSLVVFNDGSGPMLYARGSYGGTPQTARWDGRTWEFINQGLPAGANVGLHLLNFAAGPRLYALGQHQSAPVGYFWSGSEWILDPVGMHHTGWALLVFDDGTGEAVWGLTRGVNPNNLAVGRWDGSQWSIMGEGNPHVTRMILFDDGSGPRLHVAGSFSTLSGVSANGIARWTGSAWDPLGSGIGWWGATPIDMIVHDDGTGPALYVANVQSAGGMPVDWIARWDGQNWSNIGGGGVNNIGIVTLHALGSFDDGTGPALFVGGYMSYVGAGVPVRAIARYKNGVWDDMLGGVRGGIPTAFAVYDDGHGPSLFVGGEFNTVGAGAPGTARGIAKWAGCQCYANCDNSSIAPRINVDDFTCFIDKFAFGDPYVDCNQDGQRTIDDFMCFIARFAEGCE